MFPSFLLSLREGLEAALVVGVVLAVLRKLGRGDCARAVWLGVASAGIFSGVFAILLRTLSWNLHGAAKRISEGVTLFLAAGLLTWMVAWMNRRGAGVRHELDVQVRRAAGSPGIGGVFGLTFIAVAREGTELALFLTAAGLDGSAAHTFAGTILGLGTALALAALLFVTTTRLDLGRFFQVTSALLILFAAGLVAKGVHAFNELGWIPAMMHPAWNSRAVLDEHSPVGIAARTLLGYTSTPSLSAVLAYGLYLATVIGLARAGNRPRDAVAASKPTLEVFDA